MDVNSHYAVWGDDSATPEIDGALSGEELYFQLVDGDLLYDLYFSSPNSLSYTSNATIPIIDVSYEINSENGSCIKLGCTAEWADNYDQQATEDDGSCIFHCGAVWADNYDEFATIDDGSLTYKNGC